MISHGADELVHLTQHLLAMLLGVGFLGRMRHFNAEPVHAFDEQGRFIHPVTETLSANELHPFHQGAGGVAQQNPIDRIMDVGLQASGVQEAGL